MSGELWEGDDAMRSCGACMDGDHTDCADIIWTEPYGMHACGCGNTAHQEAE